MRPQGVDALSMRLLAPILALALLAGPALASTEEAPRPEGPRFEARFVPVGVRASLEGEPRTVVVLDNPTDRAFEVTVSAAPLERPEGWRLLTSMGGEPSGVWSTTVPPGGIVSVPFRLSPDPGAAERSATAWFRVRVEEAPSQVLVDETSVFFLKLDEPDALRARFLGEREGEATPGAARATQVAVQNEGDEPRWLQFRADVPGGSNVTVWPPRAMLAPGESLPVDVRFDAPTRFPLGVGSYDYPVLFLASHDTRDLLGFSFNDSGAVLATSVFTVSRPPSPADVAPGGASPPGDDATGDGTAAEADPAGAPAPPAPPGARERLDALLREPRALLSAAALAAVALVAALLAARPAWRGRWAWVLGAPLVALSTRFQKHDLLRHPTRAALHAAIRAQPGVTLTGLRDATGVRVTTLVHHLRLMERAGLVVSRRDGAHRRFSLPGALAAPAAPAAERPLSPPEREVLRLLAERMRTQGELAAEMGVTKQAVNRHVKSLERRGLVAATQAEGQWRYAPTGASEP